MSPIRCLVTDDEPLARKGIIEYIRETDFLQLAGECDSAMKAASLLQQGDIHLLFLDIEMPKLSGLHFLKTISHPPPVILTTAYPQYALEGFELNALDYLVKPISFERFMKAAMKAREYYEVRWKNAEEKQAAQPPDFFFFKADNKLVKVFYEEILFIEALQNYVAIHTSAKKYVTYLTFRSIEEYLPSDRFIRTHKSFIVSASRIDNIDGNEIRIGDHRVPISRNNKEEVMEKLLKGRFLKR